VKHPIEWDKGIAQKQFLVWIGLFFVVPGTIWLTGGSFPNAAIWYLLITSFFVWFRQLGGEERLEKAVNNREWDRVIGMWVSLAVAILILSLLRRFVNNSPISYWEEVLRASVFSGSILTFIYYW
jgi:hypothetical protein